MITAGGLLGARRSHELLWANLRLVVIDVETTWETGNSLPADADEEVRAAITRVLATGTPLRLRPQRRRVRYFQHQAIEAAGLTSLSYGLEPDRCVEVRPGAGAVALPQDERPVTHEGRYRVIEIAAVEAVRGHLASKPLHAFVNPGVPIDDRSRGIHNITDARLVGAPPFAGVAPDLLDRLTSHNGETVVLVAHNAAFDIGVLRTEFELLSRSLPDLPILDTRGPLVRLAGVAPRDGTLASLLVALRITNADAHSAIGDATATAEAALVLIRRMSEQGTAYLPELLEATGGRHAGTIAAPAQITDRGYEPLLMPPEHLDTHDLLGERPTKARLAAWVAMAERCAVLRCPHLGLAPDSLVRRSPAGPDLLLAALADALDRRAAAGDGPGANTILGAIAAVFERFCPMPADPGFEGNYPIRRKGAIAAYHRSMAAVAGLPLCGPKSPCPSCHDRRPCPRAELLRAVAPAVLDPRWTAGRLTKGSTFLAWVRSDEIGGWFSHHPDDRRTNKGGASAGPLLADAVTAAMLRGYATHGEEPDRIRRVRDEVTRSVDLGNEDPWLIEQWAERLATGGRDEDLASAVAACDAAIARRPDPPDSAWISLGVAREALASRLARMRSRRVIREDGTVEIIRPRNPGLSGRRARPLRFVRP